MSASQAIVAANWAPLDGVLEKYAAAAGPANKGAVTHSGKVIWLRGK